MAGNSALTLTYEDVEHLLFACCWQFHSKYKGEFAEWLSEANLAFMEAYKSFSPDKGASFTTWLKIIVDKRLMSFVRKRAIHSSRHIPYCDQPDLRRKMFDLQKLLSEVSEEAREVIELLTDTPADIKLAFYADNYLFENKRRWEGYMVEFLTAIGWSTNQIADTFQEITEALR